LIEGRGERDGHRAKAGSLIGIRIVVGLIGFFMSDDSDEMTAQARKCRRLASQCDDGATRLALSDLAQEYDRRAKSGAGGFTAGESDRER